MAQSKVFNDPIHGHMELHPVLVKIINTPQFQRLRNIKQLGAVYYVYPGASHNRFEHSIGVAYLAGELTRALKERQPELGITDRDVLCVEIAGLCHDLGHGPFSHLFDGMFIPKARPGFKWKHEKASIDMFDHLVENNHLKPFMEDNDLIFIKEMIFGPLDPDAAQGKTWPYKGRLEDKSFLYDIVSNKKNGVDVDKFDYFARDCHHLGMKNSFDHRRFLMFARVCEVESEGQPAKEICIRDKEVSNIYDMFQIRNLLHRRAYKHRVNLIIELMITEAFVKADPHIHIEGSNGVTFSLSTAIDDMEAYTKLTDHIFETILNSSSEELSEARAILQNVNSRNIYKYLGQRKSGKITVTEELKQQWKTELAVMTIDNDNLMADDFEIVVSTIDFGKSDQNAIDHMYFYGKDEKKKPFTISKDQVSDFVLPRVFIERWICVYCKKTGARETKAAQRHFDEWCETFQRVRPTDDE